MIKKFTALCLTVILLFSLSACSGRSTALTFSEIEIPEGVFAYYLDKVMSNPDEYKIKDKSRDSYIDAAVLLCSKYASAITLMNEKGVLLDTQKKQAVATDTENRWSLFGKYYKSIGVEKTDLTKVITHEYRMKQLVEHHYGEKGEKPVSQQELKEEFVDLYVGFKAISASLTKINDSGETAELSSAEKEKLKSRFASYASKINNGDSTIDEINISYNDSMGLITTEELEISVVRNGSPVYGKEFYKKVFSLSHNRAAVIEDGNSLYLIQRMRIATTEEDAFAQYSSDVLEQLKMPAIEKKIDKLAQQQQAHVKKGKTGKIYKLIEEVNS